MRITVEQTFDIEIPEPPKHFKATGGKRASIPIGDLPVGALEKIGDAWTANLIEAATGAAKELRERKPSDT